MSNLVTLRRHDTGTSWGFRMQGGLEFGAPLHVQKVSPNSIAHKAGLRPGDIILQIGPAPTSGMRHDQAKMEIIRAGNELDFIVQRGGYPVGEGGDEVVQQRSEVVEESQWRAQQASSNPAMQSRSFKYLQQQYD